MVGGQVHQFPKLVQEALADGHEIAMHTWSHNYMTSLTNEQIVAELKWNELVIKEATKGYSPRFFRPVSSIFIYLLFNMDHYHQIYFVILIFIFITI